MKIDESTVYLEKEKIRIMEYQIGTKILEDWTIVRVIGEGSYGKVFEIEREEFGITIKAALKVISISPKNDFNRETLVSDIKTATSYYYGFVEEMMGEIAIMSKLGGHTNIVAYEDHKVVPHKDCIGWDILIRMELLKPLTEYVQEQIVDDKTVIKLGMDIAGALEICQHHGILHGDIKPENIFVSEAGDFKLGDFGVARIQGKLGEENQKGTYAYMAPELYAGCAHGYAADLYSLALVMYWMLNQNRLPFYPETAREVTYLDRESALAKRMQGVEIQVPKYGSNELQKIIMRACQYRPEQRFKDASELKKALKQLPDGETGAEEKTKQYEQHWSKRQTERTEGLFETRLNMPTMEDVRQQMNAEELPTVMQEEMEGKKEKSKVPFLIGIMAAVFIVSIIVVLRCMPEMSQVPEFSSLSKKQAVKLAKENTLNIVWKEEYSDEISKGYIIKQDIKAGEKVDQNTKISLVLSKGKKKVVVSDFVNMTWKEAKRKAKKGNLKLKKKESYSDKVPEGYVISQSLKAGSSVEEKSTIKLVISKGQEMVSVPSLIGLTETEVQQICGENGLVYCIIDI